MQKCFNKYIIIAIVSMVCCSFSHLAAVTPEELLARFFPPSPQAESVPDLRLPSLPVLEKSDPNDVARHNESVDLNRAGIEALKDKRPQEAEALFRRALELSPDTKGYWNNLIIALKAQSGRENEIYDAALHYMACDESDFYGPYAAGQVLLNEMKKPLEAIPFFEEALKRKGADPEIAVALAIAYDRAGFRSHAFDLLKWAAPQIRNNPYPQYLLGTILLDRKDYMAAIKAFESVLSLDREGYVYDAWLRARFCAGRLKGLYDDIISALSRFPQINNRQSLENTAFTLGKRRYRFVETIDVRFGCAVEDIKSVDFLVRFPTQIAGFQKVILERASLVNGGGETAVTPSDPDADGRVRFKGVETLQNASIKLKMSYFIERRPWLGSEGPFFPAPQPDISGMIKDPRLGFQNQLLDKLVDRLNREDGNFLQNAFMAVGRGLSYRENFEERDVDWALAHPDECDCTEYSWLLAALCLKRGLPARVVSGFLVTRDVLDKETNIGHAWVDVYFKDKGWIPVDPTLGSSMQWAYFGNLLSNQIVFDYYEIGRKARVSIDFTSKNTNVPVTISNSYFVSVIE